MSEEAIVYRNGKFIPWSEATVPLMSHCVARGSSIFEFMSFHHTINGPAVFRLDEHLERLFRSVALLEMDLALSRQALHEAVMETARRNQLKEGFIKIVCYYPELGTGVLPPPGALDVTIFIINVEQLLGGSSASSVKPTTACISRWRKLNPETVPVEAKVAANYLNGMMSKMEAQKRGFENAIMLDTQGFIAEGGTESFFMVKGGRLLTPALGSVLKGISRKSVIQISESLGIDVVEEKITLELLHEAEEIFTSSTPMKILPVQQMEGKTFSEAPGPVTRRISALLEAILAGREERFKGWLFPIG